MNDKEFIFYMIGTNEKYAPNGLRFEKEKDAVETAIRLSEKEGRTFYVIECCMVCNTVDIIEKEVGE